MDEVLLYFSLKYNGDWEKIYYALANKEKISKESISKIVDKYKYQYGSVINFDYPNNLKNIYKPPIIFYFDGDKKLLNNELISLFGNDKNKIKDFIDEYKNLNKEITFVVDNEDKNLINNLLEEKIRFICIYKNGFDSYDNKEIEKQINNRNLIISELPLNKINTYNRQYYERLIIGLSEQKVLLLDDYRKLSRVEIICKKDNIKIFSYKEKINKNVKQVNNLSDFLKLNQEEKLKQKLS